ncbi:MAG TPA: acyl carrier protein [Myxococcales bacterium]|jgi:acyl carrier protein|nr:acyl carrier protein [Myxococcales bacterium]
MDEVLGEIRRVLREELGLSREARPDDDLIADLQLDSVGLLTLVVGLEDRFRVVLAEEDAAAVRTVRDLAALVAQRRGEAAAC